MLEGSVLGQVRGVRGSFLFRCVLGFTLLCLGACTSEIDPQATLAREELVRRGISLDLPGLLRATQRVNDDGAYLFAEIGFFNRIDDSAYRKLLAHAAETRNHGLYVMLARHRRAVVDGADTLLDALEVSARHGDVRMVDLLLDAGARSGENTLFAAAYNDHHALTARLLASGAPLDRGENQEALGIAARLGNAEVVRAFAEHPGTPASDLADALLRAALTEKMAVIRYLVGRGVPVDHRDSDGCTALHFLAQDGSVDMITWLLDQGAPINAACRGKQTPLRWAHYGNNQPVIDALIARGALMD